MKHVSDEERAAQLLSDFTLCSCDECSKLATNHFAQHRLAAIAPYREALEPLKRSFDRYVEQYGDDMPEYQYQFPGISMGTILKVRHALTQLAKGSE